MNNKKLEMDEIIDFEALKELLDVTVDGKVIKENEKMEEEIGKLKKYENYKKTKMVSECAIDILNPIEKSINSKDFKENLKNQVLE